MKFVPAPRLVGIEPNPGPENVGNRHSNPRRKFDKPFVKLKKERLLVKLLKNLKLKWTQEPYDEDFEKQVP